MENNGTKGIIACLYDLNGVYKYYIKSGEKIFLQVSNNHRFYLTVDDKSLFGENTHDISGTVRHAKWAYIFESLWESASKAEKGEWINSWVIHEKKEPQNIIDFSGIQSSYQASSEIIFSPDNPSNYWIGYYYRMEVFNYLPGQGHYFYFMIVDKPKIRFAYFDKQYLAPTIQESFSINDGLYSYGEHVKLYLKTHMLPMSQSIPKVYNIAYEPDTTDIELNIWLTDYDGVKLKSDPIIQDSLKKFVSSVNGANVDFEIMIPIDIKWKDDIHKKDEAIKWYSVEIKIINKKTKKEYTCDDFTNSYLTTNKETGNIEAVEVQSGFYVKYLSVQSILADFEASKNSQIQHIGDVEYRHKEFDPCGYSSITIKDEGNEKREPFTLFDEEATVIDKTNRSFDIMRGDEKKELLITVENLQNKDVLCTGVMLPKGMRHDAIEHIFLMDTVLSPKRNKNGFDRIEDKSHKRQLKESGIKVTSENKRDTDVYADPTLPAYQVASIQNFLLNKDYEFLGENQLKLKLNYWYNKTFLESYTSGLSQDVINTLWLFNYFWLSEELAQTYFVPISTCRYPNQIAKIRVFPEVEWTFHLNYGMKNPLYYRDTWVDMRQHRVEAAYNRGQAADIDGYDGTVETSFSLALECKWNKTKTARIDQKIAENLKLFVGTFIKIKAFLNKVTGNDKDTSTRGLEKSLLERIKRKPISIEIQSPKLGVAAGWKYDFGRREGNTEQQLATTFEIKVKGDPLIGAEATIDLIAWGKKLHPAAEAVITALDLLAYAANASVRFDLIFYGKLLIEGSTTLSKLKKEGQLKAEGQCGFKIILKAKATLNFRSALIEVDIDFEARAEGFGYFSAGLALGLDDHKGPYLKPIVRHSGIKIILTYIVDKKGKEKVEVTREFVIIEKAELEINQKYYLND